MIHYDPYAYAVHDDPYPVYAALRAHAPLYRNDEIGFWALSRHADVLAALKDSERIGPTLTEIFQLAAREGRPTNAVADRMAEERFKSPSARLHAMV